MSQLEIWANLSKPKFDREMLGSFIRELRAIYFYVCFLLVYVTKVESIGQIIYAVNCGGEAHTDSFGIKYERDPLHGRIGVASDYGKRLLIGRVHQDDHILYQTERYHTNTFGYDLPVPPDGDYVLVLKFSEVYFNAPDQKVFDILLNSEHTVVSDLDIFDKVGKGVAYDEYIPFTISKGHLYVIDEESSIKGGKIRLEFVKVHKDNPKINAFYIMKGGLDIVSKLPPIKVEHQPTEPPREEPREIPKSRKPSGPKQLDPYEMDESSMFIPIIIAICAFIPLLFCLCKL